MQPVVPGGPCPEKLVCFPAILLLLAFCRVNTGFTLFTVFTGFTVLAFLPFLPFYRFVPVLPIFTVFTIFTVLPRPLLQATFTFFPFYRFTRPLLDCVVFTVLPFYGFRLCALRVLHFSFLHFYRFRRAAVPGPRIPSNNAEPALRVRILRMGIFGDVITGLLSARSMLTKPPRAPKH